MFALPAEAQSSSSGVPANFPPASYKGSQFVDRKGCVFVRAGYDGNVTWGPRMTRARKQSCGQTPTGVGGATAAARPAPRAAEKPVQITLEPSARPAAKPAAAPVRQTATAQRKITVTPAPVPQIPVIAPRPAQPRVTAPVRIQAPIKPQAIARSTTAPSITVPRVPVVPIIRAQASKPVMAQPPRIIRPAPVTVSQVLRRPTVQAHAQNSSGAANCGPGQGFLCTNTGTTATPKFNLIKALPQVEVTSYSATDYKKQQITQLPGNTRILPRRSYEMLQQSKSIHVPEGYRPAWDDDRLNPYRALQTVDGYRQTQQLWTNTVPRRLITADNRDKHKRREPNVVGRAGRLPYVTHGH
jgi:hypothetical protein